MTTWPEDRAPVGTDPSAEGRGCERGAGAGPRAISLLRQGGGKWSYTPERAPGPRGNRAPAVFAQVRRLGLVEPQPAAQRALETMSWTTVLDNPDWRVSGSEGDGTRTRNHRIDSPVL